MDDAGIPIESSPTISGHDVDLHRLYRLVQKFGGFGRVTNNNKWRTIATRLKFSNTQAHSNQVKAVYKKCLLKYESFNRTLGVTMSNYPRTSKKSRSRNLIRDRDRVTPVNSPKTEKDDCEIEKKDEEKVKKVVEEKSDTSEDDEEQSEPSSSSGGPSTKSKKLEKKPKGKSEKISEEVVKREDSDDKVNFFIIKFAMPVK